MIFYILIIYQNSIYATINLTFVIFLNMNFWKKVDSELNYLGKTRKELANAVGFDVANISFGIKRNSVPAADTALKIAAFLKVPLDYLLDMHEETSGSETESLIKEIDYKLRHFAKSDLDAIFAVVAAINQKYAK